METIDRVKIVRSSAADDAKAESKPDGADVRVAYLLSQYPAISHTFFLHEVLGLRARGLHIETASINRPDRAISDLLPVEAAEALHTEYIQDGMPAKAAVRVLGACLRHPLVFTRGLLAVLGLRRLTLLQRCFWLFYLAEAMLAGTWMRRRGLDHLHVHFGGPVASVGMLVSMAWRVPYSLTIHGPEELLNCDAYHLREKVKEASFVFCISDFCRSQLCQVASPEDWNKFQVVRLGVDPVVLAPATSGYLEDHGKAAIELVCIGRLVPAKGHRILMEAMRLLAERGLDVHLTLIGGGVELTGLREFVAQHGLEQRVDFTGALSHTRALASVRNADVFVLASFAEGIPVALMEAMAHEVPCVSTSIAGIPELIESGVDGLLVPPANAGALADALELLATNEDLRRELGRAGRRRVIREYNLPLNQELLAQSFAHRAAGVRDARRARGRA